MNKNNYYTNQKSALKESFKINNFWTATLIELGKYLVIFIAFLVLLSIVFKSLYATMPLINTVEMVRDIPVESMTNEMTDAIFAQEHLLNDLLLSLSLVLVSLVLLSSLINAYFNILIIDKIRKHHFNVRKFLNLFYIYLIYELLLLSIFLMVIWKSYNLAFIISLLVTFILLKLYISSIYILVVNGKSFTKDFINGLVYKIRLDRTIIPIILGVLLLFIASLLSFYSVKILKSYIIIPLVLLFAMWSVWMKNYQDRLYIKYNS